MGMYAAGTPWSLTPSNPAGATPMIVYTARSTRSVCPITSVRPPYRVCQYALPSTTTSAPVGTLSSAAVKKRPSDGRASKSRKYAALARVTGTSSTASPSPTASERVWKAATSAIVRCARPSSRYAGNDRLWLRCGSPSEMNRS